MELEYLRTLNDLKSMIGVGTYSNMEHLVSILSMDVHLLCICTCIHDVRYMYKNMFILYCRGRLSGQPKLKRDKSKDKQCHSLKYFNFDAETSEK